VNTKAAHILIVDDEEALVAAVRTELLKNGFKNIHVAYDGDEALDVLARFGKDIHVVSLGLMMPRVKGFEVMRSLAETHRQTIAVIMLTGFSTVENAATFKKLGTERVVSFDFISKPYDSEDLIKTISKAIEFVQAKRRQSNQS